MRLWFPLAAVLLGGCNCGALADNCSGAQGDAGSTPRAAGEPCTDGFACQPGLDCSSPRNFETGIANQECLGACSDAGTCPAGEVCLEFQCEPTCVAAA